MTKYDTTKKTRREELTNEGFELYKCHNTWYVMKDGLAFAGFSTKKVAVKAMIDYVERGW